MCARHRSAGFSLIEVVVFIVVLGIAFVGMLILYNRVTSASVDPMVRKQALAIASSLLEEIELRAYTFCDPDDPNVYTATSTAGCTTIEAIGPEAGETRSVAVDVAQIAANELGTDVPTTDALRITVTATHVPTGITTSLQGYRVQYAPKSP